MEGIIIPIAICVVLPVAIVLIVALTRMNADNKRTQVILRAIDANNKVDVDKLASALRKEARSPRETLNRRLLRGCIFGFIGLVLVIIGCVNATTYQLGNDAVDVPLVFGGISLAIGLSYLVVYFMTRKYVERDENNDQTDDAE